MKLCKSPIEVLLKIIKNQGSRKRLPTFIAETSLPLGNEQHLLRFKKKPLFRNLCSIMVYRLCMFMIFRVCQGVSAWKTCMFVGENQLCAMHAKMLLEVSFLRKSHFRWPVASQRIWDTYLLVISGLNFICQCTVRMWALWYWKCPRSLDKWKIHALLPRQCFISESSCLNMWYTRYYENWAHGWDAKVLSNLVCNRPGDIVIICDIWTFWETFWGGDWGRGALDTFLKVKKITDNLLCIYHMTVLDNLLYLNLQPSNLKVSQTGRQNFKCSGKKLN